MRRVCSSVQCDLVGLLACAYCIVRLLIFMLSGAVALRLRFTSRAHFSALDRIYYSGAFAAQSGSSVNLHCVVKSQAAFASNSAPQRKAKQRDARQRTAPHVNFFERGALSLSFRTSSYFWNVPNVCIRRSWDYRPLNCSKIHPCRKQTLCVSHGRLHACSDSI